jgi:hypothetical protein
MSDTPKVAVVLQCLLDIKFAQDTFQFGPDQGNSSVR